MLEESKFCRCKLYSDLQSYRDVGSKDAHQVVLSGSKTRRNLSLCQIRWRIEEEEMVSDGITSLF